MKTKSFTVVSEILLQALEGAFPDQLPTSINTSQAELGQLVGQQDVIRFLRKKFEEQNKTVLEKT